MGINTVLVATGKVTPEVWGNVTTALVGVYMVGNVGAKWAEKQ